MAALASLLALVPASGAAAAQLGSITEYPVGAGTGPSSIVQGADGDLWVTEVGANAIARITPAGAVTSFPTRISGGEPAGVAAGPDGNIWFTELGGRGSEGIGWITPTGQVTTFDPSAGNAEGPDGIATGPDGNLWFTAETSNNIVKITPARQQPTNYTVPTPNSLLGSIAAGPNGEMWFTESDGNKIGEITTSGSITEFPIPTANGGPGGIAAGPNGNMWFTELQANKIGEITPNGTVTEFALPTVRSGPAGIALGADGNLWFTEATGNAIGQITPTGQVTEYRIPTPASEPLGIAAGPGGTMWFTEYGAENVGSIVAQGSPTASIAAPASGGAYAPGESVSTSFTCSDDTGSPGVASCDDSNATSTVSSGAGHLDTSTLGSHTYTVTATSKDGQTGTASITYTVASPPTASIRSPRSGEVHQQGRKVKTSFSCAEGAGGPGLASCDDSNATASGSGATGRLSTSKLGSHTYTVTAASKDGLTASRSITYTVVRVSIGTRTGLASDGRVSLAVACATATPRTACKGTLSLSVRKRVVRTVHHHRRATFETVVLAHGAYTVSGGRSRSVTLKFGSAALRLLADARHHRLPAMALTTLGGETAAQRTVTLALEASHHS